MGIHWDRFPVKSILNFPRILGMLESSRFFFFRDCYIQTLFLGFLHGWMAINHIPSFDQDQDTFAHSMTDFFFELQSVPFFDCFPVLPSSWPLVLSSSLVCAAPLDKGVAVCRPKYDSYPNYSQLKLMVVETPGLHTMLDG